MAQRTSRHKSRRYFRDLRDFIAVLEETGNLHRISARIEKNTELMPLVRWQYQGLPDGQRKAFLQPKMPWYGYSLGHWSEEDEENAEWAVRGDYRNIAERLQKKRIKS